MTDTGFWEVSYTRAVNDFVFRVPDVLNTEFQLALYGLGGSNCDPIAGTPGVGDCEFFNPFATSYTTAPNSDYVVSSFTGTEVIDSKADLEVFEAFTSFDVFEMGGGFAALALGVQYRENQLSQDYDDLANQDSFTFVIGNPDIDGSQDVWAAFGELALPINDELDVQLAVRYEDYGGTIGSTVDPKLAISWRATDEFSLRGSISTSFRAPTVFLAQGGATSLQQLIDPVQGATAFVAVRTSGNEELKPEESTAYNIGFSYEPFRDFSVEVDYWNFEFEDLIIQENAQAVLNDDPTNPDRVIRAGDPLTGPVLQVNNTYVNASSLETSGLDFVTSYKIETDFGNFTPTLNATYITKYDLMDPQAGNIDGAGRRNFNNIGVSSPELRANLGLAWQNDIHAANIFLRYISSYDDDQNCADGTANVGGCSGGFYEVDSHLTVDAQYNIDLGGLYDTEQSYVLTLGAINMFDEEPPQLFTNSGFDSKVHDPRGRQIYARLAIEF